MKQVLKDTGIKGLYDKGYIEEFTYNKYKDKGFDFKIKSYHVDSAIKSELKKLGKENYSNLSDIMGGATNNSININIGHSDSYWKDKSNLNKEAFAEMLDSSIANPNQYQLFKKYLPNATEEFESMIKKLTNKSLQNNDKSSILFRSKEKHQYNNSGRKIIDNATFNKLISPVIKNGGLIQYAEDNNFWDKRLKENNASAMTIDDVIVFRRDKTISEVLEEIYHFKQNQSKINNQYEISQRTIMNEILAKKYLLKEEIIKKYKIPAEEINETKKQLDKYLDEREKLIKNGKWIIEN